MTDHLHKIAPFNEIITEPSCVFAFGLTYAEHIKEIGEKVTEPVIFMKRCLPQSDPKEVLSPSSETLISEISKLDPALARWLDDKFDSFPTLMDYEVELGMVLLEDVSEEAFSSKGFNPKLGYFLANDVSARSVQIAGQKVSNSLAYWSAAKSLQGFLPVSEYVYGCDEADANAFPDIELSTRVNGEVRQQSRTSDMIYSPKDMLAMALKSAGTGGLKKHDLILTGTPSGVALSIPRWKRTIANALPRYTAIYLGISGQINNERMLKKGDSVKSSIAGLCSFNFDVA